MFNTSTSAPQFTTVDAVYMLPSVTDLNVSHYRTDLYICPSLTRGGSCLPTHEVVGQLLPLCWVAKHCTRQHTSCKNWTYLNVSHNVVITWRGSLDPETGCWEKEAVFTVMVAETTQVMDAMVPIYVRPLIICQWLLSAEQVIIHNVLVSAGIEFLGNSVSAA